MQGIEQRVIRFICTGICITGVHIAIAFICIFLLQFNSPEANGLAFIVSTLLSYMINTLWSFSSVPKKKNFYRYFVVACIGFFFSVSISFVIQELGKQAFIGTILVALVVPPLTFLLHNFWTYK